MALEMVLYNKSIFSAIQSEKLLGDLSLMKFESWAVCMYVCMSVCLYVCMCVFM